jgi:hypothetical protein
MRLSLSLSLFSNCSSETCLSNEQVSVCLSEVLASLFIQVWHVWKCLFTGRADFSIWVVITTFNIFWGLFNIFWGFLFCLLQLHFDQSAKGDLVLYNSRHDQSAMGIDPMNNISNNNQNTLCSYIISTLPLNKKGILQQHQARERIASSTTSGGQHHQYHLGTLTGVSINHRKFSSSTTLSFSKECNHHLHQYELV